MSRRVQFAVVISLAVLATNSALLWAFPTATAFNVANLLLHVGLGAALGIVALIWARANLRMGWVIASALTGVVLAVVGNTHDHRVVLFIHVVLSLCAFAVWFGRTRQYVATKIALAAATCVLIAGIAFRWMPHPEDKIVNSRQVALSMDQEGAGPKSPFFPAGSKTSDGHLVPSSFFMESKKCGECHRDIYEQWKSSAHHFASFNNQFYRKSIEYMQSVVGTQPSKWCAGCHDHAVFFNGRFDRPIKEQIDTPEAQAGLSCMSCHSMVHVAGTVGNGGFTMSYPPLHEVANSANPLMHSLERFVTYAAPEAHRRTFMKPFMRQNTSAYCSACHKVHLDVPVNQYRWFRGFNDYDNWQASGVSGEGARSFYYPAKVSNCADCHMPLVDSHDPGNISGKIHSHSFPAANTAVPFVNDDQKQLALVENFLKSGFISVDIFAVSPVIRQKQNTEMVRRGGNAPKLNTTFAVGEEAEQSGPAVIREVSAVAAPADISGLTLQPGSTARVDIVVRTRKIGHFFPGGTVDAFDVWLELKAEDDSGKCIFWSGGVEQNGKGPVDPGAHFYRSYQLDAEGNPINKRNAWQARSVLYVRLIPPGAADVAHYLVHVPQSAKGHIHFTAKLNYRKFSWYYTQFAYAGQPRPGQPKLLLAADHNGLDYSFDPHNIPQNVSGKLKGQIPDLPTVVLAKSNLTIPITDRPTAWNAVAKYGTRERWNDWGIGLLLQGDLKAAEFAFQKAAEADPHYADAPLNTARTLIQEGETDRAKPYIEQALKLNSSLGRIYYFRALIEKSDGNYDLALQSLKRVESQYPRDRVVLNQIARILFLQRKYTEAVNYLQRVCDIDPEDVQMHYTAMLCYRGLRDDANAKREQILFQRFKADEASQTITAQRRMTSPEDNNERQQIHDHESMPLPMQ
ncbi:MAG TPA: tetratricopeptide repeat protein [Bryobacteraceae bacterium]|jgi:tetratricopeptide (TPR) repeat protein|nr:tetratricopeptide repeat protein [Bryobacteraceae bacterium]